MNSQRDHFIYVVVGDKQKLPITGYSWELIKDDDLVASGRLGGTVEVRGLEEGEYTIALCAIVNVQWGAMEAEVGEEVSMTVTIMGMGDDVPAKISVYVKDSNFTNYLLTEIETSILNNEIKETFTPEISEKYMEICDKKEAKGRFSNPLFFFTVTIDDLVEQSGLLRVKDWVELECYDESNCPVEKMPYRLYAPNGVIIRGVLNDKGHSCEKNLPPGITYVEYGE